MKPTIKKDRDKTPKKTEELHAKAILWKSEINFINDEIRFLEHILSSNYIDCLAMGLSKRIETLVKKMSKKKKEGGKILTLINQHEGVLSVLIESDTFSSNEMFLVSHKNLENEFDNYLKHYKFIKKHIFKIIEDVMRKKNQKKLK